MATPINPGDVLDFDQPLNTDPDYSVTYVFSTNDITGTFAGGTGATYIDFSGASGTKITKEGVFLLKMRLR